MTLDEAGHAASIRDRNRAPAERRGCPYRDGHGGYIQPCEGTWAPLHTSTGARLFSAAATVVALRGREYLKPLGRGSYRIVFPAVVAARERVSQNQKIRLDYLSPGRYVILAQYTGGNVRTWLDVLVAAGRTVDIDLPDLCM